ncbi:MAG: sugar phosphate isomerase/epimerase family protein [Phycisphaeraceae bacterium]
MYLTGFADEAGVDLATQVRATLELGWRHIESRQIDGVNLHDLDEPAFERVVEQLDEAGVSVNCFGSTIANWGCSVHDDFEDTLARVERAIPRMQRLGSKLIRVMSYRIEPDRGPEEQYVEERFKRMRELVGRFVDAGLQPVHENCMNYGGMGWTYTLRMLDAVPGLKLVFDTGNPCFTPDYRKPRPWPRQSAFEFYSQVKEHVAYIHIKDALYDPATDETRHTMPGDGHGDVRLILEDLLGTGYDGGISIEPHLASVFHDDQAVAQGEPYTLYVAYGRRLMEILDELGY